jgi:hypothetical protein
MRVLAVLLALTTFAMAQQPLVTGQSKLIPAFQFQRNQMADREVQCYAIGTELEEMVAALKGKGADLEKQLSEAKSKVDDLEKQIMALTEAPSEPEK